MQNLISIFQLVKFGVSWDESSGCPESDELPLIKWLPNCFTYPFKSLIFKSFKSNRYARSYGKIMQVPVGLNNTATTSKLLLLQLSSWTLLTRLRTFPKSQGALNISMTEPHFSAIQTFGLISYVLWRYLPPVCNKEKELPLLMFPWNAVFHWTKTNASFCLTLLQHWWEFYFSTEQAEKRNSSDRDGELKLSFISGRSVIVFYHVVNCHECGAKFAAQITVMTPRLSRSAREQTWNAPFMRPLRKSEGLWHACMWCRESVITERKERNR